LSDSFAADFKAVITAFRPLITKPAARFADAVEPNDLILVADFLNDVAKRKSIDPNEQGTALRRLEMEIIDLKGELDALKAENTQLKTRIAELTTDALFHPHNAEDSGGEGAARTAQTHFDLTSSDGDDHDNANDDQSSSSRTERGH
jgi:hypothetical protein